MLNLNWRLVAQHYQEQRAQWLQMVRSHAKRANVSNVHAEEMVKDHAGYQRKQDELIARVLAHKASK